MASCEGLDESVDFDFFETPRSPVKDFNDSDMKNYKTTDITNPVSKPPVQPKGSTPVPSQKKNVVANKDNSDDSDSSSESSSDHYSDSESMSSDSVSRKDKSRNGLSSKSSVSVSSRSTVSSLSSDKDIKPVNKHRNQDKKNKNVDSDSSSSTESDDEERPSNPTAKAAKLNISEKKVESDHSTDSSEEEGKYRTYSKISRPHCDDDGDYKRSRKTKKVEKTKSQAWAEGTDSAKQSATDRPKTAKGRVTIPTDSKVQFKSGSASNSLSDSDITDVSPIESPRNNKDKNAVKGRRDGMGIRGAGDGYYVKQQFAPITDIDLEDPDRLGNLDLSILMKAVGELEKQTRLKTNTRRVMFAPMSVNRGERGNYTFDDTQTREIERENNRLLKEIVRRVNSREQARVCTRNHAQKLTPSAVNREREIRRIEMENLAILKRLKKVKPTKSISRDNQLKQYESTMLHGVPMATLHPMPRVGRRTAYDDSASSMSSFASGVSSVRSLSSRQSSRPGSAVRRPTSAKRYSSDRPDWSDRW